MDRGAWRATVHGVTKSRTELSTCMHAYRSFYFCPWETTQPQRQSLKMWVRSHHAFVHSCPNAINFTQCKRQSLHHVSIITHRLTKSSFQPPPFPYLTTVLLFSFSLYCSFVSSTFFQQARDARIQGLCNVSPCKWMSLSPDFHMICSHNSIRYFRYWKVIS